MPMSKWANRSARKWDCTYNDFIIPSLTDAGNYEGERSKIRNGAFTEDIIKNLKNSYIVLADITGFNPNVMWELGIRQTLSNRTILICRQSKTQQKNISDMGIYGVIFYKDDAGGVIKFKKDIKEVLEGIDKEPDRIDNPVHQFLKHEDLILFTSEKKRISNLLTGLLSELILEKEFCDGILNKRYVLENNSITLARFTVDAMRYLLITNYAPVDKDYLSDLRYTKFLMEQCNKLLELANLDLQNRKELGSSQIENIKKKVKEIGDSVDSLIKETKKISDVVGIIDLSNVTAPLLVTDEYIHLLKD